ncbi:MAG: hypothetical protein CEN89_749 [Candidatus Berkelbacteria bacterium Licking1014_7]|uniref:DUF4258 domain-containing protein n=1 Tax=Candidatus Berkelbacteria bacterium Licking1014_7 TaxID=2017147 RepID=A0A554LHM5_9BACT|nr:MAG: hypothetical protein CEN89_749 [Candidatus Berkelbacteria bacterium Licking1014_7]
MEIVFTKHARARLKERGISEKNVKEAIIFPDKSLSGYANKKLIQKKIKNKNLVVIYIEENKSKIIITTYWR